MKKEIPIQELSHSLEQEFNIASSLGLRDQLNYEDIRSALAIRIALLLKENKQLLYASLYRIDVAEKDVRMAMAEKETPSLLAELILQKLSEKIYWRTKYRTKQNDIEKGKP